jgi:hypothetical protein
MVQYLLWAINNYSAGQEIPFVEPEGSTASSQKSINELNLQQVHAS